MTNSKSLFLEAFAKCAGIVAAACSAAGITRQTFYSWLQKDADFAARVYEIKEAQIDAVESKLLDKINAGDTTAMIFYLKTRGKERGWSEKPQKNTNIVAGGIAGIDKTLPKPKKARVSIGSLSTIKKKEKQIIKILQDTGKYTQELLPQIEIAAQLLARTEQLEKEIFSETHKSVNVEYSREGNTRETISPKERLYMEYASKSQSALRALGMNTDTKTKVEGADTFNDFLNTLKDESI